jgi:DNA-binding protein H-NS
MNYEELKTSIKSQIETSTNIKENLLREIGQLVAERDCTEAEANKQIEDKKTRIKYYNGQIEAYTYSYNQIHQLTLDKPKKEN